MGVPKVKRARTHLVEEGGRRIEEITTSSSRSAIVAVPEGRASTADRSSTTCTDARDPQRRQPSRGLDLEESKRSLLHFDDGSLLAPSSKYARWLAVHSDALGRSDVKGRLADHYEAWTAVCQDPIILDTIKNGYSPLFSVSRYQAISQTTKTLWTIPIFCYKQSRSYF